jgi:predicted HTH domain antitoxin
MKANINKDMAKRMKRKESLDLELGSSHLALKIDRKEKKKEKMVTLFDKGRIIFSEMNKF